MASTSWLVGSNPAIGPVEITINAGSGNDTIDVLAAAGPLYLYDGGSGSLDALLALQTAIRGYAPGEDLTETVVYLTRDRKVRIDFGPDGPVDIVSWGGAGADAFQELLGFTGSELVASSVTTFTAPATSPYLWSPNKNETPGPGRLGKDGVPYFDTAVGMSATRRIVTSTHNSGALNDFLWERVLDDRYWSDAEAWGEYYVWWNFVQRHCSKFKLWRGVDELDASTDAATLSAVLPSSGAYVYRPESSPITFPMSRDIAVAEFIYTVRIPVVVVDEYE